MTSPRWLLALTVAWIAVAPSLAVGQTPDPPEPIAPAVPDNWDVVESAVRTELAQRWHTDPGHLVLDWGPHSNVGSIDPTVPVELVGSGSGGSWVVRIAAERGAVGIRMRAGTRRTVRVAAGPMRRGHVLTPSDVTIEERTEWGPPLEGSGPIAEAGWVVERGIAAGDRLTAPAVRPAPVVRTGEPVEVAWSSESSASRCRAARSAQLDPVNPSGCVSKPESASPAWPLTMAGSRLMRSQPRSRREARRPAENSPVSSP